MLRHDITRFVDIKQLNELQDKLNILLGYELRKQILIWFSYELNISKLK